MLRAQGLFAQATTFWALREAALKAARGHRQKKDTALFLLDLERNVLLLQDQLLSGVWGPGPLHHFHIRDPKPRQITAVPFADRVVHHAFCEVLVPILDRLAIGDSYACRVGKGGHAAIQRVQQLSKKHPWYMKLDIRHFFETVDHAALWFLLGRRINDPHFITVLSQILVSGATAPGQGLPIGSLTSQHLGNFLLSWLDQFILRQLRVLGYVRYMDDMLLFGPSKEYLRSIEPFVSDFVQFQLRQLLKSEATVVAPVRVGVPYLGFRIWPRQIRLDSARIRRLIRKIRGWRTQLRQQGESEMLQVQTQSVLAWAGQAQISRWVAMRWDGG